MAPLTVNKPTWFFWIDEYPGAGFAHPTRFILLDAARTEPVISSDAVILRQDWWPEIALAQEGGPTALLPASYTHRTITVMLLGTRDAGAPAGIAISILAEGNEDACAIAIYGPTDGALENSAEAMAEFFETQLHIPPANVLTGTNFLGSSIPSSPDMLRQFLDLARNWGCKKLYLYIACHGYSANSGGGLVLGNGNNEDGSTEKDWISHADLGSLLEPFRGTGTQVCVIVDACFSAGAIQHVQNRGVDGTVVTAADRGGFMTFPRFAFGRSTHFTSALIDCWEDLNEQAGEAGPASLEEAFAWVQQEGGSNANNGDPRIAAIDAAGGVFPLGDVFIERAGETVAVTIHRPPGAVGDLAVTLTIADPAVVEQSDPDNPTLPFGEVRRFTLRDGTDSRVVHLTGLHDGTTTWEARTLDDNQKDYRGAATIQVGSGYGLRLDPVGTGETRTALLTRFGAIRNTPRATTVDLVPANRDVVNVQPASVTFSPGQTEITFTIEGHQVNTTELLAVDPLYDLSTSTLVVTTGSACSESSSFLKTLGISEAQVRRVPLGNPDCTALADGSHCAVPEPPQKICGLTTGFIDLDPQATEHVFNDLFPCGPGPHGLTVCTSSAPPEPGRYLFVNVQFEGEIPLDDPFQVCQYGFAYDSDGVPGNNFVPGLPYANDWYGYCDRAFQLGRTPGTPWRGRILNMSHGDFALAEGNARFVIDGREVTLISPMTEFATATPAFRITAHCHLGDYGLQGLPWSGDYFPLVGDPLFPAGGPPVLLFNEPPNEGSGLLVDGFDLALPPLTVADRDGTFPVRDGATLPGPMLGGEFDVAVSLRDVSLPFDGTTVEIVDGHFCLRQDATSVSQVFLVWDGPDQSPFEIRASNGLGGGVDLTGQQGLAVDILRNDTPLDAAVVLFSSVDDSSELTLNIPVITTPTTVTYPFAEFRINGNGVDPAGVTTVLLFLGPGGVTGPAHLEIDAIRTVPTP